MAQNWYQIYLHFVWATIRHEPLLTEELRKKLYPYIESKCREIQCNLLAIGRTSNHVHILLQISPLLAPTQIIQTLKGSATHHIHFQLQTGVPFKWQSGYGISSVSKKHVPAMQTYILNQEIRHREGKTSPFLEALNDSILISGEAPEEQST